MAFWRIMRMAAAASVAALRIRYCGMSCRTAGNETSVTRPAIPTTVITSASENPREPLRLIRMITSVAGGGHGQNHRRCRQCPRPVRLSAHVAMIGLIEPDRLGPIDGV